MSESGEDRPSNATRDQQIGRNVAHYRGDRSQEWLGIQMRAQGHKWSQSTVWSVEAGTRPLRFTEAQDLAVILGIEPYQLLGSDAEAQLVRAADLSAAAAYRLQEAVYDFLVAHNAVLEELRRAETLLDSDDVRETHAYRVAAHRADDNVHEVVQTAIAKYGRGVSVGAGGPPAPRQPTSPLSQFDDAGRSDG